MNVYICFVVWFIFYLLFNSAHLLSRYNSKTHSMFVERDEYMHIMWQHHEVIPVSRNIYRYVRELIIM